VAVKLKKGVTLNGVQPEIVLAILLVRDVLEGMKYDLTVTSLTDGLDWRKSSSLHLAGLAFDVRIWDFTEPEELQHVAATFRSALGDEFDVVVESDHIHVEFDPK